MKSWINVGVVGTGSIYRDGHRRAFVHPATDHMIVVGLCDLVEKRAKDHLKWLKKEYKKKYNEARKKGQIQNQERFKFGLDNLQIYTSYNKMLDDLEGTMDLVDNCTPGRLHIPYSVDALNHGYHAMAEKPPGLNWWDVKRIVEAEEKTKKCFQLSEHICFERPIMKTREVITAGKIGTIQHVRIEFGHGGPYIPLFFGESKLPHFIDPLWSGGGCLQDLGPHGISHGFWPVGRSSRVLSCQTNKLERRKNPRVMSGKPFTSPVDDWAEASLEMYDPRTKSNYIMDVTTSWCQGFPFPFDIETDKGTLSIIGNRLSREKEPVLMPEDDNMEEMCFGSIEDRWESHEPHIREIQIFADNLLHGQKSEVDGEYALRLQETLSIHYFSKLMKRRVTMEEMDRWGQDIMGKYSDPQKGIDAITKELIKAVELL